jgi:hypothetical protein
MMWGQLPQYILLSCCSPQPFVSAGDWAELEVDTWAGPTGDTNATKLQPAHLHLSHLKSYENMGTALVDCVSGCTCEPQSFSTLWDFQLSLMQIHIFEVGAAVSQLAH